MNSFKTTSRDAFATPTVIWVLPLLSLLFIVVAVFLWSDNLDAIYALLLVFCTLVIWVLSWLLFHDILAPTMLMSGVWLCAVLLRNLYLAPAYQSTFTDSGWIAIIGGLLTFCIGAFLMGRFGTKSGYDGQRKLIAEHGGLDERRLKQAIVVCFIIGMGVYIYNVYAQGGISSIPFFSSDPEKARFNFSLKTIGQLVPLFLPVTYIGSFVLWTLFGFWRNKFFLLLSLAAFLPALLNLTRYGVIDVFLAAVIFRHEMRGRRIEPKLWLIGIAGVSAAFLFVSIFRTGSELSTRLIELGYVKLPSPQLVLPYIYITNNIDNLQFTLQTRPEFTWGTRMLMPGLAWLRLIDASTLKPPEFPWTNGTPTYLADPFLDFGYLGVFIVPFVLGSVTGFVYKHMRTSGQVVFAMVYSFLGAAIVLSVMDNFFSRVIIWMYLVMTILVWLYARRRSKSYYRSV